MIQTFLKDRKGNLYLNGSTNFVKGQIFSPPSNEYPIVNVAAPTSAVSPTSSNPVLFEGQDNAYSELYSLMASPNQDTIATETYERACVNIYDVSNRRNLMNREVPFLHAFGSPRNPFFMPESLILRGQQSLQLTFLNKTVGGSVFSVSPNFEGQVFQRGSWSDPEVEKYINAQLHRKLFLTPYWLTLNEGEAVIPASGTSSLFMTVNNGIAFMVTSIMATAITAGVAGNVTEKVTLQFFDGKTERPLQNQPVARTSCSGSGNFPYVLLCPWMLEPNSLLRVQATNLVTDATTRLLLTLHGVACFVGAVPH